MNSIEHFGLIAGPEDPILITGASGFIGLKVVECLLNRGFRNLRCFARPSSDVTKLEMLSQYTDLGARLQVIRGNLLSREDCANASKDVRVIFHLAAARGEKSFPDAFMNSVVTTRNLIEASLARPGLRLTRFGPESRTRRPGPIGDSRATSFPQPITWIGERALTASTR